MKVPVVVRGIVRWVDAEDKSVNPHAHGEIKAQVRTRPLLVREAVGTTLREVRMEQGKTLRDTSSKAQVALGYLSEVERAQKEASSEIIAAICESLGVPLSQFLRKVSDKIAASEPTIVPDTIPNEMFEEVLSSAGSR